MQPAESLSAQPVDTTNAQPPGNTECRIASDGEAYSWEQYLAYYKDRAASQWLQAKPVQISGAYKLVMQTFIDASTSSGTQCPPQNITHQDGPKLSTNTDWWNWCERGKGNWGKPCRGTWDWWHPDWWELYAHKYGKGGFK